MRSTIFGVLFMLLTASGGSAFAQGLGTPVETVGSWTIHRSTDSMTDRASCVATYGEGAWVQMTNSSFAIAYRGRGGIRSYRIRLNDDAPWGLRLPTRVEERIGAFVIEGRDYQRIVSSARVRVQALAVTGSVIDDDVAMTDVPTVLAFLNGPQCQS